MSAIESEAKRPLARLIAGEEFELTAQDQEAIALLVCLITMRADIMSGKIAIPPSDRDILRLESRVPDSWSIWCGKFVGWYPERYWYNKSSMYVVPAGVIPPPVREKRYNTQASTFVWGSFCCIAISSAFQPAPGALTGQLVRLFPAENSIVDTSRMPRVNDKGAASLGECLNRSIDPSQVEKNFAAEIVLLPGDQPHANVERVFDAVNVGMYCAKCEEFFAVCLIPAGRRELVKFSSEGPVLFECSSCHHRQLRPASDLFYIQLTKERTKRPQWPA